MKDRQKKTKGLKILIVFLILLVIAGGAFALYMYTTPQITLQGDKVMEVTMKDGYEEPGATASFAFHDISDHIDIDSQVDTNAVGSYKVIYTVHYLEKTATAERTVEVVDKEPPEITLLKGDHLTMFASEVFEDPGVRAVDDSDGDVTWNVKAKGYVDMYNKGDYEIEYSVSDSYGNEAFAYRTVTVKGKPNKLKKGVIYLTFDDGPSTKVTDKILKTLEKYKVPATFFVIDYGDDPKKIALMQRALDDGCAIGVHGYSHDYSKIYKSEEAFMENVTSLHDKLLKDLNYDAFAMRFPGGSSNTVSINYCKGIMTDLVKRVQKEGYMYNDWNVDSTDASANSIPAKQIIASVKAGCDPEKYNIILMHDSDAKMTTAEALPAIIKWAKKEGYEFRAMTPGCPTYHHSVNN